MRPLNERVPDNECYMGVDVFSSPPPARHTLYSMVVLCGEKVVYKNERVPIERLIRLSWEYMVKGIGVDNPFELAPTAKELLRIGELLPEDTELIQVNLIEGSAIEMRELLRKLGYSPGRLTPMRTAYYLAMLAGKGYGTRILEREAMTKIFVKKKRSLGPGGMSSNRYKRKVRTAVLQITNMVKKKLDEAGLEYEVLYRKTSGGLEGSVFVVYAHPRVVRKTVKPRRGTSVSVEVKPYYSMNLKLSSSTQEEKAIIVGVDPGLNTGLAILDLTGSPVFIDTKRQADRSAIIDTIRKYGRPAIVATDVSPVPEKVKKLASLFNAQLYVPERVMSAEEKHELASNLASRYGLKTLDSHMRDALAAAYSAYKHLSDKLEEVDRFISTTGLSLSPMNIKKMIIEGKSIADAVESEIKRVLAQTNIVDDEKKKQRNSSSNVSCQKLLDEINMLRRERQRLLYKNRELERRIDELERRIEREHRLSRFTDRKSLEELFLDNLKHKIRQLSLQLKEKETVIERLEDRLSLLSGMLREVSEGSLILVPVLKTLTRSNLNAIRGTPEKGLVYIDNPGVLQDDISDILYKKKIRAVVVKERQERELLENWLVERGIPVVEAGNHLLAVEGSTAILERGILGVIEQAIRRATRIAAERERERLAEELLSYRKERIEHLKRVLRKT